MIAIAVDDEPLMLAALVKAIKSSRDIKEVSSFTSCEEALSWVKENKVDIAFLDINMRGMGGLLLAEKIMEVASTCNVIFCTGHEEYALSAFKLHASGYLMKPISAEDVQEEINNIKRILRKDKTIYAKCFGNFEVYADGQILNFKRKKTKELFAYLIDRNGAGVSAAEIEAALWDETDEKKNINYLHQLIRDLRLSLESVGEKDIFERNNYYYSIHPEKIDCDYFSYLKEGKPEFHGEYMSQYSWAEQTCALLWRNKKDVF